MSLSRRPKSSPFLLALCVCFAAAVFSCASAPEKSAGAVTGEEYGGMTPVGAQRSRGRDRSYFSRVPAEVLSDVENGSPASLRRAAQSLRKSDSEYEESEKVLLAVASGIMRLAWPSERADWTVPAPSSETSYTGAIESAGNGIYDTSTGNVDFLTLVLPSLAVMTAGGTGDFFDASERALSEGLRLRPDSVLAHYLLGRLYRSAGRDSDALPHLAAAAERSPECLQTNLSYAECLHRLGREDEANRAALALASRRPADADVLRLCAETAFAVGDYEAAEKALALILQQNPNDLDAVLFRARVLMEVKDYIHAALLLDVYARQDSTSKDYLLLRARIQYDWSRNTAAAVSTIEAALQKYPDDRDVLLFAARLAVLSGADVGGRTVYEYAAAVLASDPDDETALQYAAEGFVQNSDWQKAYGVSSSLMRKDSPSRETVFRHIRICLALGKKEEAWNLVQPLYRESPDDEAVLQAYILVLGETDRTAQARQLIDRLLSDAKSGMKSFLYYRRSFLREGEADALSDLRASLIANPRNRDALFRLYKIYYDKRDYRKAQYYLKQVVALSPNDPAVRRLSEELTNLIK